MSEPKYTVIDLESVPRDPEGNSLLDLYVHLPTSGRYVRFIAAGDSIEERKVEALKQHPIPTFFSMEGRAPPPLANSLDQPTKESLPSTFPSEVFGQQIKAELKEIFIHISGDQADPSMAMKRFESMSDSLVAAVAPDVKNLSDHLRKQSKYLHLMSDAAAISTLAIICAFANGFDSQKSFRELAYATLVMDISMTEFSEEEIHLYYAQREALPPDVLKAIMFHPMRSYQLAEQKLKSLSDVTMQLILTHHELYNGKGFPRAIRTEALFPVARVLSLSVDIFEELKKSELNKTGRNVLEIVSSFVDPKIEPHMRRHNKKIVDTVIKFFESGGDVPSP